MRISIRNQQPL